MTVGLACMPTPTFNTGWALAFKWFKWCTTWRRGRNRMQFLFSSPMISRKHMCAHVTSHTLTHSGTNANTQIVHEVSLCILCNALHTYWARRYLEVTFISWLGPDQSLDPVPQPEHCCQHPKGKSSSSGIQVLNFVGFGGGFQMLFIDQS